MNETSSLQASVKPKDRNNQRKSHKAHEEKFEHIVKLAQRLPCEQKNVIETLWAIDRATISMGAITQKLQWYAPPLQRTSAADKVTKGIFVTSWGASLLNFAAVGAELGTSGLVSALITGGAVGGVVSGVTVGAVYTIYRIGESARIHVLYNSYDDAEAQYMNLTRELDSKISNMTTEEKISLGQGIKEFFKEAKINKEEIPQSLRSFGYLKRLGVI